MALYGVEQDLSRMTVEEYRRAQERLIAECAVLRSQGRRVRFISSVLDPAAARGLCLFGSESRELVNQLNEASGLPSPRIFEVLDLTPSRIPREMSRGRPRPGRPGAAPSGAGGDPPSGGPDTLRGEIWHWIIEGRRLVAECIETMRRKEQIEGRVETLEQDNERLREEVDRIQQDMQILMAERDELLAAFHALAGRVGEAVGQISQRLRRPR
jgi:hypothetical protein